MLSLSIKMLRYRRPPRRFPSCLKRIYYLDPLGPTYPMEINGPARALSEKRGGGRRWRNEHHVTNKKPLLPYLELLHEGGDGRRGVDEDDAEAAGRVHGGEAGEDVGAGAVPQTDHHLHAQVVQHVHQVLADLQCEVGMSNQYVQSGASGERLGWVEFDLGCSTILLGQ